MSKIIRINRKLSYILCAGLVCRLIVLMLILSLSSVIPKGFYGMGESISTYDDNRYLAGAEYYADNAKKIIDIDTFTYAYSRLGDNVGINMVEKSDNPLAASTPLWYWIICLLIYFTKTELSVRLLNIVLSLISIYYLYLLANYLVNDKVACLSAGLLSVLPYPVVFSCFAYKDQFIMFIYLYSIYWATVYRLSNSIDKKKVVWLIVFQIALMQMRGGLSIIFLAVLFMVLFYHPDITRNNGISLLLLLSSALFIVVLFIQYQDIILAKLNYYVNHRVAYETSNLAKYLSINGFSDLYKLPALYFVSILMPIGINKPIVSWYHIVSLFGFFMTPIALGNTFYLFVNKKYEWLLYYLVLGFYIVSIVASIGNPRHYYSLLPFILLPFADYYYSIGFKEKRNLFLLSLPIFLVLLGYFIVRL